MTRRIIAVMSPLGIPWSWNSCRVVIRIVPLPTVLARSSMARYCSGVHLPPGIRTRTIIEYAFSLPSRFKRVRWSRSSCW